MAESRTNETLSLKNFCRASKSLRSSAKKCEEGSTGSEMHLIHNDRVLLTVKQGESQ